MGAFTARATAAAAPHTGRPPQHLSPQHLSPQHLPPAYTAAAQGTTAVLQPVLHAQPGTGFMSPLALSRVDTPEPGVSQNARAPVHSAYTSGQLLQPRRSPASSADDFDLPTKPTLAGRPDAAAAAAAATSPSAAPGKVAVSTRAVAELMHGKFVLAETMDEVRAPERSCAHAYPANPHNGRTGMLGSGGQGKLDASLRAGGGTFSSTASANRRINALFHAHMDQVEAAQISSAEAPFYLVIWGKGASYARALARVLSGLDMSETRSALYPHGHFLVSWIVVADIPADAIDAATDKLPGRIPFREWRSGQEVSVAMGWAILRLFSKGTPGGTK